MPVDGFADVSVKGQDSGCMGGCGTHGKNFQCSVFNFQNSGSGRKKVANKAIKKTTVPTIPAARATESNVDFAPTIGAIKFVVRNAAEVPSIRPPTLVAKLPPVPRRCSGKTFGRYSPK